jgi:fibronectin type 3 domain-containing protein
MSLKFINILNRTTIKFIVLIFFLSIVCTLFAEGFEMIALTESAIGRKPMVLLLWDEVADVDGFNIYRKTELLGTYSRKPINSDPISLMTDCEKIKSIITKSSKEWKALSGIPFSAKEKPKDPFLGLRESILRKEFDPCVLSTLTSRSELWEPVQFLARYYYKIGMVLGQAFVDEDVSTGESYWYEIRSVKRGSEMLLASNIHIVAGVSIPLPAPANVHAEAGDSEVLITWDEVNNASGYDVYRKEMPWGAPIRINAAAVMSKITHNLEGDSIAHVYGFIDFRRWDDETGWPTTHDVEGNPVAGPINGVDYQYQVSARNSLDQPGDLSSFTSTVTPIDKTPPGLPIDLSVEAVGQTLKITWSRIVLDQLGHYEMDGIKGYNIYRSETQGDTSPQKLNIALIPQPFFTKVEYIDSDPAIQSHFGEKEFYYRIDCTDMNDNIGFMSSAAHGHVDDIYPPDIPVNVSAEGHQEYIRIFWDLNTEPDIGSYVIYRSLCHLGQWIPPRYQERLDVTCGDFAMIAEITHADAEDSAAVYGQPFYDDYTVPKESPLCYAYWVKARDNSQNLSGDWPYPSAAELAEIVCQRLRDETPPPPPIVIAVQARDDAIYLEWIAAPSQDLGYFHVYRSKKETEGYVWIGGKTVEEPPTLPSSLTAPIEYTAICSCDVIPLVAHEGMNAGSFLDKRADPKIVYWYKVAAVDQNGNQNKLDKSVPYSTFTFKTLGPEKPVITVQALSDSCGLEISWTPAFDPSKHLGFIVFRGPTQTGIYRQISQIVQADAFVDSTVNSNVHYWYKVQALDIDGRPSELSLPQKGSYEE